MNTPLLIVVAIAVVLLLVVYGRSLWQRAQTPGTTSTEHLDGMPVRITMPPEGIEPVNAALAALGAPAAELHTEKRWHWFGWRVQWRDVYVGVYWKQETCPDVDVLHLYICLLPCLPLHLAHETRVVAVPVLDKAIWPVAATERDPACVQCHQLLSADIHQNILDGQGEVLDGKCAGYFTVEKVM